MLHDPAKAASTAVDGVWSGLLATFAIAAAAFGLRMVPGLAVLSPMILAILIGIAVRNLIGTPAEAKAGIDFAIRRLLRLGIVLLGLQLTAAQVADIGWAGLVVIVSTVVATLFFTTWFGRVLRVERKLAELIAAGTSICGASAVIAANTVTRAPDEDLAYAVATVTIFGSIAMFVCPLLAGPLHLDLDAYALWVGSSIHEIAQVVAAAFQQGGGSGELGTAVKLSRVLLLAPMVMVLAVLASRRERGPGGATRGGAAFPWFVLGFAALACLNSVVALPEAAKSSIAALTTFLLSVALAAMGLETDVRKLRAKGLRPLLLAAAAWIFIAGFSLVMVKLLV